MIRSATLTRDGRHWFVSFLVDDGVEAPAAHTVAGTAVGVDRGVAAAIATSDGDLIDRQFLTSGEQRRAVVLQRTLSRVAKRGRNRDSARRWPRSVGGSAGAARTSTPRPTER